MPNITITPRGDVVLMLTQAELSELTDMAEEGARVVLSSDQMAEGYGRSPQRRRRAREVLGTLQRGRTQYCKRRPA